mmetsp:Transcript_20747/g.23837  ORF Transcript_20747/g.23837 Transcript_20747/m.23837 type:complete len:388 (-) Transcript_20747:240-1403(-)
MTEIDQTIKNQPCQTREETISQLSSLHQRSPLTNVHGMGPMLISDIPLNALQSAAACPKSKKKPVIMGIDEAGRGPVLGPMTYGAAYWTLDDDAAITNPKRHNFMDSKLMTPIGREQAFEKLKLDTEIGFVLRVIHASEISRNMLQPSTTGAYNLNEQSHDAAIQMIQAVLDAGVVLDTVYIDTVGTPSSYQRKLERRFAHQNNQDGGGKVRGGGEDITFVVEKKADSKYETCSAASIVAKVMRDEIIKEWEWSEVGYEAMCNHKTATSQAENESNDEAVSKRRKGDMDFGSGYPSDPKCKEWMKRNIADPVFGYPDFVRFSWGTTKTQMLEKSVRVDWEHEDDPDAVPDHQQTKLSQFCVGKKKRRLGYFHRMGLKSVTDIRLSSG